MATAILIVVVVAVVVGSAAWLRLAIVRAIADSKGEIMAELVCIASNTHDSQIDMINIRSILSTAKPPSKPAESVFDRDTLQPTVPRRYVPMAVRRAQAEAASLGPQTHDAKVRENNARAIESAG